jgi:predicted dehydrogenase
LSGGAGTVPARVALVGAGGFGLSHRQTIAQLQDAGEVVLVGLADVRPVPDAPPGVPVHTDHRALLDAVHPDIVVVSTPPYTHAPIAADALHAGADVLVEKPPVVDLAEHRALSAVLGGTGRSCQVGFQALGSRALTQLLAGVDGTKLTGIAMRGAWMRDDAYFQRAAWVGRSTVDGRPALDGALANPFAHAVTQVLAIAAGHGDPVEVTVERYRTRDIEVEDTATLRLTYPDGMRALLAVTLCAEEFRPGDIAVDTAAGTAVLEYPTDRLRLPGEPDLTERPGRTVLLSNLVAHRRDGTPLVAPLSRTVAFTAVMDAVRAAPVATIPAGYLSTRHDMPTPRLVIDGINAALDEAVARGALFSELDLPWAVPGPGPIPWTGE